MSWATVASSYDNCTSEEKPPSLAYVKEQMGHSSIQVTVDVYGHLVPGGDRAAVDRLDDLQPSATPAQPEEKIAVGKRPVSALCPSWTEGNTSFRAHR